MILTKTAKIIISLVSVAGLAVVGGVSYLAYNFYQKAQKTLDDKNKQQPVTANQTPQIIYQTTAGNSVSVLEVITAIVDLSGTAPSGAKYGVNTATGKTFYVNTAGNWASSSTSVTNSTQTVNLASKVLKNGNVEKYPITVTGLTTDNCLFRIESDLSSQPNIIYSVLGIQKDNELSVQISNFTGTDINTLPLTITIFKIS